MTENTNIKYVKNICDFCGEKRVLHFFIQIMDTLSHSEMS